MNRLDKHNAAKAALNARKPSWWTDGFEASWSQVRSETLADWGKVASAENRLEQDLAEQALAFGHGSREAYASLKDWTDELVATLKTDWKAAGHEAENSWEQVSAAVKHGWERALRVASTTAEPTARTAIEVIDATLETVGLAKDTVVAGARDLRRKVLKPVAKA